MSIKQLPLSRSLKFAAVIALIAGSTLGVNGQRHRGTLSSDLGDSQQHADE